MSLTLTQSLTACAPGLNAFFLGTGGSEPYTYEVLPSGAGGSIDSSSGAYLAPTTMGETPDTLYDTIQVTDDDANTATAQILVGTALFLFCEVIQRELELANGRVYLWDQKIFQPTDSSLYIAVSVPSCKPFSNITRPAIIDGVPDWSQSEQVVNMLATCDIDIISRGPSARDRKEEVILALNSIYAQSQQEINGFYIGKLPPGSRFLNLSLIDGAAIPYRFKISVNLQYAMSKTKPVPYFDTFQDVPVTMNP